MVGGDLDERDNQGKRDEKGKWIKGYAPPPIPRGPNKLKPAIVDAIAAGFPPSRIVEMMEEAYAHAVKYKSPKMMLAVARFAMDYMYGRPNVTMDLSKTTTNEVAVYLMAQAGGNLGYDISPYRNLAEQAERIGGLLDVDGGEVDGDWKLSERADDADARESVVIAGESKREEQIREEERKEKGGEEHEEQ